jgi:CTP-dependent riboflavin kinase
MMSRGGKEDSSGPWVITGHIVGGSGKAAYFTRLAWVQEQCMDKLGFIPYPGTLNIACEGDAGGMLEILKREANIVLDSPDPDGCSGKVLPLRVGGIPGALILPSEEVNIHGSRILEIIAPVGLKDALELSEGDSVTLQVERPGTAKGSGTP